LKSKRGILPISAVALGRQRTIKAAAAVHILPGLALCDISDAAHVGSGHRLALGGIESGGDPKLLHHLKLVLVHTLLHMSLYSPCTINPVLALMLLLFFCDSINKVGDGLLVLPIVGGDAASAAALGGRRTVGEVAVAAPIGAVVRGA
jgi:hypothetical protein